MVSSWLMAFEYALLRSAFIFLPAMVANALPVVISGVVRRKHPLDFGLRFIDGKRLLGENKSIEGFLAGAAGGFFVGCVYAVVTRNIAWIAYGAVSGVGAMIGDSLNSFIKRRLGIRSGEPFIPMDQLSFILVAYALVTMLGIDNLTYIKVTLTDLAVGVYIVMVLHPLTNLIAYILGLKDTPL